MKYVVINSKGQHDHSLCSMIGAVLVVSDEPEIADMYIVKEGQTDLIHKDYVTEIDEKTYKFYRLMEDKLIDLMPEMCPDLRDYVQSRYLKRNALNKEDAMEAKCIYCLEVYYECKCDQIRKE